jgi:hypothetical protein
MKDEALKLALEALENHCGNYKLDDAGCDRHEKAITAINEALAQPEQKPMALIRTWHKNGDQHAELVDWGMALQFLPDGEHCLYATPPAAAQPAQRKPLTMEQIELGRRALWGLDLDAFTAGARFAETAHGIK